MPKYSVIMPCYNRAWIVRRAIDSVLSQSLEDFELIIINDGSQDDSAAVIAGCVDQRITYINLEKNIGQAAARNIGIKRASGDLIAYLDTDNLWYPNYLEVMLTAFTNTDIVMAYSGQNLLLTGGDRDQLVIISRRTRNVTYNPIALMKANYIDVNCAVHTRRVLNNIGLFDESLTVLEDWDLFVRMALRYPFRIKHVDHILSEYHDFLPTTSETLSNHHWSDATARRFGIKQPVGDAAIISKKIEDYLSHASEQQDYRSEFTNEMKDL